jgi:hypothetical protein
MPPLCRFLWLRWRLHVRRHHAPPVSQLYATKGTYTVVVTNFGSTRTLPVTLVRRRNSAIKEKVYFCPIA